MKSSFGVPLAPLALISLLFFGCTGGDNNGGNDAASTVDAGSDSVTEPGDQGEEPVEDMTGSDDVTAEDLGMLDMANPAIESEPNDGQTLDEVDDLEVGQTIQGAVAVADSDVFHVITTPGRLYEVELTSGTSPLQPHVTVLDDGRDGDAAGGDYVKISRDGSLRFLAMGEGGYYVAVRDARNVDGASVGGSDHTYSLRVSELPITQAVRGPVPFGSTLSDTLGGAADVHLWTFEGMEGTDVRFDFSTSGDLDGRLQVFSEQTGSWIARQDDRTASDPDPLLDAPLTASGNMYLVVENIADQASALGYAINASTP